MDVPDLVLAFGLVATVLTGTALASGLVERSPLSFPLIFLALGLVLVLGGGGTGVLEMDAGDPALEAVATLIPS